MTANVKKRKTPPAVALIIFVNINTITFLAHTRSSDLVQMTRGLIYKGIYAQKMAYASFYAMFAIYKILT